MGRSSEEAKESRDEKKEEETPPKNFKYPERCRKQWSTTEHKLVWREYLGAGQTCEPALKEEEQRRRARMNSRNRSVVHLAARASST